MWRVDSLEKTLMLGGIGGQEEKGTTEDEMVGWHHRLNRHESEWTPGVGDGQGGLACCDSWGHKGSDTTEQLNWTELNWTGSGLTYGICTALPKHQLEKDRSFLIFVFFPMVKGFRVQFGEEIQRNGKPMKQCISDISHHWNVKLKQ